MPSSLTERPFHGVKQLRSNHVSATPDVVDSTRLGMVAAGASVYPHAPKGVVMDIPRTMKATVLVAPHRFELQERPVPVPGDEDVLVRVRACGV